MQKQPNLLHCAGRSTSSSDPCLLARQLLCSAESKLKATMADSPALLGTKDEEWKKNENEKFVNLMLDVIGIDEAQFFEDLYDFCCEAADHDGKTVIVAGLDGDYLRRRFGSVLDIIPIANSVMKLMARCEVCGKQAQFTLRKTDERETELIGGADVYMPVCRQHYVSGQVVIETARSVLGSQKLAYT
ncbi:hypothetical protein V6N13_032624 [Hibiscus sabdariffa]|uniref:Thymidine kinase n=1 Tax=Hibiscus sabdariffa TaxID=183260 RepID=A0ABR2FCI5_9ROSI